MLMKFLPHMTHLDPTCTQCEEAERTIEHFFRRMQYFGDIMDGLMRWPKVHVTQGVRGTFISGYGKAKLQ